jgi:hypothetical protein
MKTYLILLMIGLLLVGCSSVLTAIPAFKEVIQIIEIAGSYLSIDWQTIEANEAKFTALGGKYGIDIWTPTKNLLEDWQKFQADKASAMTAFYQLRDAMKAARGLNMDEQQVLDAIEKTLHSKP